MATGAAEQIEVQDDERLELAKSLQEHLLAGDEEKATEVIDKLVSIRESTLFQEIGHLTRQLHDSIGECYDDRITTLARNEMPNARERLTYVVEKTEESANRTLSAVEESIPLSEQLSASAEQITDEWQRFQRQEMNLDDFRIMAQKIGTFLEQVNSNSGQLNTHLSEIMMAQEYQDLTGQVINQVINIVAEVESNLVRLIKCAGLGNCEINDEGPDIKAEGPQVNPVDNSKVVSGQDDVDDLLSSLGF